MGPYFVCIWRLKTCEVVEHPGTLSGQRRPRLQVSLKNRTQSSHDMDVAHLSAQVSHWTGCREVSHTPQQRTDELQRRTTVTPGVRTSLFALYAMSTEKNNQFVSFFLYFEEKVIYIFDFMIFIIHTVKKCYQIYYEKTTLFGECCNVVSIKLWHESKQHSIAAFLIFLWTIHYKQIKNVVLHYQLQPFLFISCCHNPT